MVWMTDLRSKDDIVCVPLHIGIDNSDEEYKRNCSSPLICKEFCVNPFKTVEYVDAHLILYCFLARMKFPLNC